jgi:hypothetical protein
MTGGVENGVVRLRQEDNLRGKRQDPWRKANDRGREDAMPTLRKWTGDTELRCVLTGSGGSAPAGV